MIRTLRENDLTSVMQIWLDTNISAHSFIPKEYWIDNYAVVKNSATGGSVCVRR